MFGNRKGAPHNPVSDLRRDRVLRVAVVGIVVYALGLIPFYLLTPVRPTVQAVLTRPQPTRVSEPRPVRPTPSISVPSVVEPTPPALQTPVAVPTRATDDARFAILLLGYGGANHDGGFLTDSIMVVIVDPANKTMTLLSIPRDSWVPMAFNGKTPVYNKINTAYAFAKDSSLYPDRLDKYAGEHGAGVFAAETVSRLIGVPVAYYFALDFQGFRQMIDAVGGIDVDVPVGFAARYPANDDPAVDPRWIVVRFQTGVQHMTGERAIEYARARETIDDSGEGSDFARSRRQRLIIEAFKTRLFQPGGIVHLPELLAIASQHVDTNYAVPAVTQMSQLALDWRDVRFYQTALTASNYLEAGTGPEGTYVLVPSAPNQSWSQIRAFVRRLWDDPSAGVAEASTSIVVENDSGYPSVGTRFGRALTALGYRVASVSEGTPRAQSEVIDRSDGVATPVIAQLVRDIGLDGVASSEGDPSDSPQLVIVLGADQANLTLSVPEDSAAPASAAGLLKAGDWVPDVGATASPSPSTTITPSPGTGQLPRTPVPPRATPIPVSNSPNVVVVPNLVGLPEADAQRVINESGLMTTYVNYQSANDVADRKFFQSIAPGAVLSQSPPAGTKVPRGTRIAIAVRKS